MLTVYPQYEAIGRLLAVSLVAEEPFQAFDTQTMAAEEFSRLTLGTSFHLQHLKMSQSLTNNAESHMASIVQIASCIALGGRIKSS